jgi:hypothetical protein
MMKRMKALGVTLAAAVVLLYINRAPVRTADNSVVLVRVPANGIQPEAIVDSRGILHLLYFAGEPRAGDLFYVRSRDYGQTFSTPVRVNSQPGSALATGTIRGGQLAIGRSGRVHVTWNGSEMAVPKGMSNPADGQPTAPFLYTRSNVEGTRFEAQRNLTTRGYFIDGGGSIAADSRGNVYATWHAAPVDGPPGEDRRRLWIARSTDEGATFSPEQPAWQEPTGACGCCGVRMFAGPSDALYVLYRSATATVHRDMFLLESNDQGRTFRGARVQPWEIGACPMTSMAMASSASNVFAAWETAGQVYFGEIDAKRARIPVTVPAPGVGSTRKHPRLAVNGSGDVLVVWTVGTAWARGGALAWQTFDSSARVAAISGTAPGVPVWSFGAAIARPDGRFVIFY